MRDKHKISKWDIQETVNWCKEEKNRNTAYESKWVRTNECGMFPNFSRQGNFPILILNKPRLSSDNVCQSSQHVFGILNQTLPVPTSSTVLLFEYLLVLTINAACKSAYRVWKQILLLKYMRTQSHILLHNKAPPIAHQKLSASLPPVIEAQTEIWTYGSISSTTGIAGSDSALSDYCVLSASSSG